MTEKRHVETVDGIAEYLVYDEAAQTFAIQREADVTDYLEANKARQNDGTKGWSKSREWKHEYSVPVALADLWKAQYGVDWTDRNDWPRFIKLCQDADYRLVRVS